MQLRRSLPRFSFRSVVHALPPAPQRHRRAHSAAGTSITVLRDRALDHVVEREKNFRSVVNLKNLMNASPSKSLPLSAIADQRDFLRIPIRPIDFVRRYFSIFEEFRPEDGGVHPHVRLTPAVLDLDTEERLMFESEMFQSEVADRLLKLLMLCRINKIPLSVINRFRSDLGLPPDYLQSIVPQFPDYFQLCKMNISATSRSVVEALELVCWSDDLAVSSIERTARNREPDYQQRSPIPFPLQFSKGFEMSKEQRRSLEQWQKLPYISPYENASHLPVNSDESDKWATAVLHELLHLLPSKKTDRENVICFADYVGLRSRIKKAIPRHPGIFYVSSKNRTHTVVLREAFRRHELVNKHGMMDLRSQFLHLMNTGSQVKKKKQGEDEDEITHNSKTSESVGPEEDEEDDEEEEVNPIPFLRTEKNFREKNIRRSDITNRGGNPRGRKEKRKLKFHRERDLSEKRPRADSKRRLARIEAHTL